MQIHLIVVKVAIVTGHSILASFRLKHSVGRLKVLGLLLFSFHHASYFNAVIDFILWDFLTR